VANAQPTTHSGAPSVAIDSDRLTPYVPRIAVEWLRKTPDARHRQIEGSLAFVDMSGFTALTERLSKKGKVGAEEMNDLLDACFAELLSVAYAQGAGVIKWGGDAVLLLFDGAGHESRACRAALNMQRQIRSAGKLRTSSGLVTLRMSVGIHSGAFDFFLVGDLHRELVITGPAASTTVEMETVAEAGEVAISPATAAALEGRFLGREKGPAILLRREPNVTAHPSVAIGDVGDLDVAQLLPIEVREHLLAGGGEAEHRLMAPAFIHFMGADELLANEGPDALADALDVVMRIVQRSAHEHQVAFFETDIAPSGGKVMLMGGAPRSTGNDEERMLRAMRAVLDAGSPLPLRIGVNWGRIFVGNFGPPYRRTYSVKGDAVNLAARLMAKAEPGQLLTTDGVLERARTRFDTVELEPFQAKGKAEPVQAYVVGSPLGLKERSASAPLVGREYELSVLVEALDSARHYEGKIVELVAEPGMGKSRLIEELRSKTDAALVFSVQCEEYESATPYSSFRNLLREYVGGTDEDDPETIEQRLRERVEVSAPQLTAWLPLIGVPFGLELPDTPETAPLADEFRKARLEEVTRELLGMLLLETTLLVFEDTHWMDDASADLLRELIKGLEQRPWLVVVARRDQPTGFAAPEDVAAAVIELQPLGAAQAAALAHAATEETPLLPHEIEALTERAGGNPLFLTELMAVARQAGGMTELPDSVESLMTSRIDRLSPTDRRVLRCAAVVGASFTKDLVDAALAPESPAPDVWERLGDFLVEEDGHLRFRHALVRDAAYEGLPYRRRREVHGRVGDTIEERAGEHADDEAELLSLHFFNANEYGKAWRYSRIAGERAAGIYANMEAAAFFERALAAARRRRDVAADDRAKVQETLGDVRVRLGEFEKAGRAFKASRQRKDIPPLEEAQLMHKEALVPSWLGKLPLALRYATRALNLLQELTGSEAAGERARLYAVIASVRIEQGRTQDAIKLCRLAVEEAESAGAREPLAHAYFLMDWCYASLGRYEDAIYSPRALAIYEELGNLDRQGLILNNMGVFAHFQGRWDEALDLYRRAEQAWAEAGNRWNGAMATANVGEVLSDQGRLEEGEPFLRDALRVARASESGTRVSMVGVRLGRLLARMGRFEEAHPLLGEARDEYRDAASLAELCNAEGWIAECLMLQGDSEAALAFATEVLERGQSLKGVFDVIALLNRVRGSALLQLGRLEEARVILETAVAEARQRNASYELALALDALATLAGLTGEEAEELEQERDAILERLGVVSTPELPLPALAARPT
jgi:class 3 adenylate cyclase/tetratricopeptide (TPR) repeat protein